MVMIGTCYSKTIRMKNLSWGVLKLDQRKQVRILPNYMHQSYKTLKDRHCS